MLTTIQIDVNTRKELAKCKIVERESYDSLLIRMIEMYNKARE
jgi:hypothetical protein